MKMMVKKLLAMVLTALKESNTVERFNLENPTGFGTFVGYGYYDHGTGLVRIYVAVYSGSVLSSVVVARVPAKYRPSSEVKLAGGAALGTGSDGPVFFYPGSLDPSSGNITHSVSGVTRAAAYTGEYTI